MLGYSREEILKFSIADILMEEELPRIAPEVERLSESKLMMTEWKFRRKDGTSFIGELSGRKLTGWTVASDSARHYGAKASGTRAAGEQALVGCRHGGSESRRLEL